MILPTDHVGERYPTLQEFVAHLLSEGGKRDVDIASELDVSVKTVNGWAAGGTPGKQHRKLLLDQLGYDLTAYLFSKVAHEVGFPQQGAPIEVVGIRTYDLLIAYLRDVTDHTTKRVLTHYFEIPSASVLSDALYLPEPKFYLSEANLFRILSKLYLVPDQMSGAVLTTLTPLAVVSEVLKECRLASGQNRADYAEFLVQEYGIPDFNYEYLGYFEDITADRNKSGRKNVGKHVTDLPRHSALLQALSSERRRLRLTSTDDLRNMVDSQPTVATPAERPATVVESETEPVKPRTSQALPRSARSLEERVRRLEEHVFGDAAAEELLAQLTDESMWHEHEDSVTDALIEETHGLIVQLGERLIYLAKIKDEAVRAQVRKRLTETLQLSLVGAMLVFAEPFPSAALSIVQSWQRTFLRTTSNS